MDEKLISIKNNLNIMRYSNFDFVFTGEGYETRITNDNNVEIRLNYSIKDDEFIVREIIKNGLGKNSEIILMKSNVLVDCECFLVDMLVNNEGFRDVKR